MGNSDIDGQDWGNIFANAINGGHLDSPLGLADVIFEGMAWSAKSIKKPKPHTAKSIRIISGRCSPDYSYGITDPHKDIQKTGDAVLGIWNERVGVAKANYEPLRTCVLVRNFNTLEFLLFEKETERFVAQNYIWKENKRGIFDGFDAGTNKHIFAWQPHGAQFSIYYDVPLSARKFKIKRPPILDFEAQMKFVGFDQSWVTIL
jgi:hypothetical protein